MFGKKSKSDPVHVMHSLIDKNSTITGDVTFTTGMEINGRVSGNIKGIGEGTTLNVGKDATIEGSIEADYVFVDGKVIGPVKGAVKVEVRAHGKISGDVEYGKIQMEEGSEIKGQLVPIPVEQKVVQIEAPKKTKPSIFTSVWPKASGTQASR